MFTLADLFCGAGGSSTGAVAIDGVAVKIAANHWDRAIETHSRNHPGADHVQADISNTDPRYFPSTDLLWASPSCTKHSIAQGKKRADAQPDLFGEVLPEAAAERSRATMWDVVRFAEYHAYAAVIVENVVDVYHWPPFQAWRMAMESIGYAAQFVWLNSMHAQLFGPGAPQSRDRFYAIFTRADAPRPDVSRVVSPPAVCPECGPVRALQVFKRLDRPAWGKYRAQYVYRCPNFSCRNTIVEPAYRPAADIIDWTLPGTRIGDRERPLSPKTMNRIHAGANRYWGPLPEHTDDAIAMPPFIAELRGGSSDARPVTHPLAAVTASGNHHALITAYYGNGTTTPATRPLGTVTTLERHALLTPATGDQSHRPTLDLNDAFFRMLEPKEIKGAMDFPAAYQLVGTRREQVRLAGNAVTPPAARDLIGLVIETLTGQPAQLAA
ncbi:DNA cytosine methyltransferase [Mycolicibacterium fallax]|uniref:DNA (cytosine-5-)-methyltransferase n=1 Tax=Mycolicibacterium fallax TaxID=1793 RepID=A0A1X1RK94_MYCFA|nr:DNA cytosine methyltransferase [Mycolicibacterium fallax]ORV08041.1 DNA methyltransferase [Mycolicibacterium fallax]